MKLQTVVFDASTLILLAKAQLLVPFLRLICGVMPLEVQKEVLAKPEADDTVAIMEMVQQGNLKLIESPGRGGDAGAFWVGCGRSGGVGRCEDQRVDPCNG